LDLELIQRFAVTLAIGLLIGMERGWDDQETRQTPRIAGVRTFALIALLGALWQLLGSQLGALILAVGFLGFAALYVSASWIETRGTGHYGITTEIAAFITFTLGAMTMHGHVLLSAATAVIVTIILSAKPILAGSSGSNAASSTRFSSFCSSPWCCCRHCPIAASVHGRR